MTYNCQMCRGGADTRESFVQHMLRWHGVAITVQQMLDAEGLTPQAMRRELHSRRMREAWKRRRKERASLAPEASGAKADELRSSCEATREAFEG